MHLLQQHLLSDGCVHRARPRWGTLRGLQGPRTLQQVACSQCLQRHARRCDAHMSGVPCDAMAVQSAEVKRALTYKTSRFYGVLIHWRLAIAS
jgi:hypothetical protein